MDETVDEHPVVRMQPQQAPQLVFVSWYWPAHERFQIFGVRGYLRQKKDVSQVPYLLQEKVGTFRSSVNVGCS